METPLELLEEFWVFWEVEGLESFAEFWPEEGVGVWDLSLELYGAFLEKDEFLDE